MKILVTGGAGFIGSNYVLYILKKYKEHDIINLDKLTYAGNKNNLISIENDKRYTFVEGDICDKELVDSLVEKVDLIVHFAAESHVDRSILGPRTFLDTNIIGTYNLLESALQNGKKRFHHISTDEVYGSLTAEDTKKFSEETPYDPHSPYSASKAAADHIVRTYFHTYGLPITISNCSNNYGPYQFPEKLIPLFISNLIERKHIPVYGSGENIRDWIYVEDHVRGIDEIIRSGVVGETYCLGGNEERRNIDIARMILKEFKLDESFIDYVDDRKGHDFRYAIDSSKAKKELGWEPVCNFEDGLRATIGWYTTHTEWWGHIKKRVIKDITK